MPTLLLKLQAKNMSTLLLKLQVRYAWGSGHDSSSSNAGRTDTQGRPQAGKGCGSQSLRENVRGVIRGRYAVDHYFIKVDEVSNSVVADAEMFTFRVPLLVLGELTCRVVIAE
jgi:hypothetical protein